MNLRIERVGQGEKIAAVAAVILFACMFLSWFNFSFLSESAWDSMHYISPILAISVVATVGVAIAEAWAFDLGDIPGGLVIFVLGSLSALLILIRLIDPISIAGGGVDGSSISASVEAGAFLGFLAALGIAAGGYIATDGKAIDRLKALLPSSSGTSGSVPGTPQPAPPPQAQSPGPLPPTPASTAPAPDPVSDPEPPTQVQPSTPPPTPAPDPTPATQIVEPPAADPVPAPAAEESRTVFCEGCGAPLRSQDRFCRKCGQQQAQPAP